MRVFVALRFYLKDHTTTASVQQICCSI